MHPWRAPDGDQANQRASVEVKRSRDLFTEDGVQVSIGSGWGVDKCDDGARAPDHLAKLAPIIHEYRPQGLVALD
jgi:hypothetical protein